MTVKKAAAADVNPEPVVTQDEGPHYIDRFGHRHELSEQDVQEQEQTEEQMLPALPPAS